MAAPLSILGDPRVGAELLAAADVRSVRALTGNPEDTRVIARFSWHRSLADVRAGATTPPSADDASSWTLIPGAMRPAYQCTEDDAGRWLRVTVVPLATSSSGGRGSGGLDSRSSGAGQAPNRPMLRAVAGPIAQRSSGGAEQASVHEAMLPQSSHRVVMVEGQYTAVAEGGNRLMVHLNPSNLLIDDGAGPPLQLPPQQQQQLGEGPSRSVSSPRGSQRPSSLHGQGLGLGEHPGSSTLGQPPFSHTAGGIPLNPQSDHWSSSGARPSLLEDKYFHTSRGASSPPRAVQQAAPYHIHAAESAAQPLQQQPQPRLPTQPQQQHWQPGLPSGSRVLYGDYAQPSNSRRPDDVADSERPAVRNGSPGPQARQFAAAPSNDSLRGPGPGPSSPLRLSGKVQEVISGNYALSELQQWTSAVAAGQLPPHVHHPADGAAVAPQPLPPPPPPPPHSSGNDALAQFVQLAEGAADATAPWQSGSTRSGFASSTRAGLPTDYAAAAGPGPSLPQQRLGPTPGEGYYSATEQPGWGVFTSEGPRREQGLEPPRGSMPRASHSPARGAYSVHNPHPGAGAAAAQLPSQPFPEGPQRGPLGLSRSEGVAGAPPYPPPLRGFATEPDPYQLLELARHGALRSPARSPVHEAEAADRSHLEAMASVPSSPFGRYGTYAAAAAAAAAREARAASPVVRQRLDHAFQSLPSDQLQPGELGGRTGGVGASGYDLGPSVSVPHNRTSGWPEQHSRHQQEHQQLEQQQQHGAEQRSVPTGGAAGLESLGGGGASRGGGGLGTGRGSGSLREALEQLLAQHQEAVQQADSHDAAASQFQPPQIGPALTAPALGARQSAPTRGGGSGAPDMRPYQIDTTAALPSYPLGRNPPAAQPQPTVRFAPDAPRPAPVPLASLGSGGSSLSLSNSFGLGLVGSGTNMANDTGTGSRREGVVSYRRSGSGLGSDSDGDGGHDRSAGGGAAGRRAAPAGRAAAEVPAEYLAQLLRHAQGDSDDADGDSRISSTSAGGSSRAPAAALLLGKLVALEQAARGGSSRSRGSSRTLGSTASEASRKPAGELDVDGVAQRAAPSARAGTAGDSDDHLHSARDAGGRGGSQRHGEPQPALQPPAPRAPSSSAAASVTSSSLQDMRNMNEALLKQLAESTRLQMQMQKALDGAMEQLITFHAKEQQQKRREPAELHRDASPARLGPAQSSPPRLPSPPPLDARQTATAHPPPAASPSRSPPAPAAAPAQRSPSRQCVASSQSAEAVGMDPPAAAPTAHPSAPRGSPQSASLRRGSHPTGDGAGLHTAEVGPAAHQTAQARGGKPAGVAAQPDPEPARPQRVRTPGKTKSRAAEASRRVAAMLAKDDRDAGDASGHGDSSGGGRSARPGLAAGAGCGCPCPRPHHEAAVKQRGGVGGGGVAGDAGGAADDDAQTAAALRALLHQHHLRWRAKKAKLKEQAQAWQYTAWRYATAWKKARAMLQAMVAAQEGAAKAATGAEQEDAVRHHPSRQHGPAPPADGDIQHHPMTRRTAGHAPARGTEAAGPSSDQQAEGAAHGRTAEPVNQRRPLSQPRVLAGIAAALQRRDPSPGTAAAQPLSAYAGARRGQPPGGSPPRNAEELLSNSPAVGGAAMRDAVRYSPPVRARPKPQRKRGQAADTGPVEDPLEDTALPAAAGLRVGSHGNHAHVHKAKHATFECAAVPSLSGTAGWSDVGLDSGSLRDQGSRGRSAGPRYDAYDLPPAPPERVEIAAQWPTTLRSGADGQRSRSASPPLCRPPWKGPGSGGCSPSRVRITRPAPGPDRDASCGPDPVVWPMFPADPPPHPPPHFQPSAAPCRDPDGWWNYPEGWLDIYQPRPPHILVQHANAGSRRHHHRYDDSQGNPATSGVAKAIHPA